jgi:hypothetical protein
MALIMIEPSLIKEEASLVEAFRSLKPEAQYMVLTEARSALIKEEQAGKQEQIDPPAVPIPGS